MSQIPASPYNAGPATFTAGRTHIPTAGDFNSLRDWINVGGGVNKPIAAGYQTVGQSIANATWTDVLLDSESVDSEGIHSTSVNTARLTIQTPGYYAVEGMGSMVANVTGIRRSRLLLNGTSPIRGSRNAQSPIAGETNCLKVLALGEFFAAGNYLTLQLYQTSGAGLSTDVGGPEVYSVLRLFFIRP